MYNVQQHLNVEKYMKWLAFNYLIQNGDYTDEVLFYQKGNDTKFDIIPWDYDDLFNPNPHETCVRYVKKKNQISKIKKDGNHNNNNNSSKIYSLEDPIDRTVLSNSKIYNQYLDVLNILRNQFLSNLDKVKEIFILVHNKVSCYYDENEKEVKK